jgi:hypothetical protein
MEKLTEQQIEAQIDQAIARRAEIDAVEPRANKVIFESSLGEGNRIALHFDNGVVFSFPTESVEAISTLPPEVLAAVELTPSGKGLRWDEPDVDLSIQGLLLGIFGNKVWINEIAAKGGRSTSEKKKAASRVNGNKGGRPRKIYQY